MSQSSRKKENAILQRCWPKTKLNTIKVLNPKDLINSYINHDEVASANNVLTKLLTFDKNGVETIVDNNGILWLNEKHRKRIRSKLCERL